MINTVLERICKGEFVLIAEIGVNYYDIAKKEQISPIEAAKLMIYKAKEAGIHAVKFQTYKAATLAAKESPSYWDLSEEKETSQYSLFRKFDALGEQEYRELSEYCESVGIEFLSTPFDVESADYLEPLMNIYKISSSDLNNLKFIEYQAKKNKPIILSVGASDEDEIREALECIRRHNDKIIVLMHCVLEYPTPYEHANLNKIVSLAEKFQDVVIGYSDHTKVEQNYDVIKTAYLLGARVIEKHYTLDKSLAGNDHYHAMDDLDAKNIIRQIDYIEKIRGSYEIKCLASENVARLNARRSLVASCDIKKGMIITEEMITYKRPGTGILAKNFDLIVGKKAACDIQEDTILQEYMFDEYRI